VPPASQTLKLLVILTFKIDKRLLFYLSLTFIGATVIGTVSHEFGHYLAARIMGFDARINYAMTWLTSYKQMSFSQKVWFTLAGPLQTMLTGTIGFIFLNSLPKPTSRLSLGQWTLVFVTLFWLRQSANFVVGIGTYLLTGKKAENGDEIRLSYYLNWPEWSIVSVTGLVGFIVLAFVLFKFIPKSLRLTFILSGLIGGISGYILWLVYFGKLIMP
jgi:hypothetical protein